MALTPEEIAASEDLERRLKQEAAQRTEVQRRQRQSSQATKAAATPNKQQPQSQRLTSQPQNNRSQAINRAAQTAQPQQRQSGWATQIGQVVDSAISGDWMSDAASDAANAIVAGGNSLVQMLPDNAVTNPIQAYTQAFDDNVRSSAEIDQILTARRQQVEKNGTPVEKALSGTANNLEAVAEGMQAGINIPSTILARITNQANPWSDPPAIIKDSPISSSLFEIAQILTPTLIGGGIAGGLGKGAVSSTAVGYTAESLLETATQDNFDELLAGRKMAGWYGEVAEHLNLVDDGALFARDLVEGKTVNAQVVTGVTAFLQNFIINFGADKLVNLLGKGTAKAFHHLNAKGVDRSSEILAKPVEQVDESINNINKPAYSNVAEPSEVIDADSAVPVSKATAGNVSINEDALVRQATSNTAYDGVIPAGRNYFTNWNAITDDSSLQRVMQEATATLKKVRGFPDDMKTVMDNVSKWWDDNRSLLDTDFDQVLHNFAPLTRQLEHKDGLELAKSPGIETYLREYAATAEDGFLAAGLVGEELGSRIQHLAKHAVTLEEHSVDFQDAVEVLLNLHDKLNLFLIPLRRGKRKWAIEGSLQQKRQLKHLQDADIQGAIRKSDPLSFDADAKSFETIKSTDTDPGDTLRTLWQRYQRGDDEAGAVFKDYLNAITYTEPTKVLSEVVGVSNVLKDSLKKANSEARTQVFYFSMLSRLATQTASAGSNIARLFSEPVGAMAHGATRLKAAEFQYGWGQFVGGIVGTSDAFKVWRKAMAEGRAINGGSKIDDVVKDLAKEQEHLNNLYQAKVRSINENGGNPAALFGTWLAHASRTAMNHPLVHFPGRALMAADEWTKTVAANQVALGRAYKKITEKSVTDQAIKDDIINLEFSRVFKDLNKHGKIIDAEVLDLAKHLTFQKDIPGNGNFIDNAFLGVKTAADNSAFWKFVSPFTRVSYNVLETVARFEPSGLTRQFVPQYKKIMAGEFGETAKLQLQSQLAAGQLWTVLAVTAALNGFVTGVNSGSRPKQSFIVPADNKDGYNAFSYSKIEPFATLTAVIADVVNGVKNEVISEGQYEKFISNVVFSLGMASFDKTFTSGMADFGSLFDAKNLSSGSVTGAANITSIVMPGVGRMLASWSNPYKTVNGMEGDAWENFAGNWRARAIGGHLNPKLYDELTGKPIPTVATAGSEEDYFGLVWRSIVNEAFYPGRTAKGYNDPVRKTLDEIGFSHDSYSSIKTYGGVALSPEQQSILSKDLHDFGNLRGKLLGYFNSDEYKKLRQQFNAIRRKDDPTSGSSVEGTRANTIRDMIFSDIRTIYRQAKEEAVSKGRLAKDSQFLIRQQGANDIRSLKDPVEALLNWTNI